MCVMTHGVFTKRSYFKDTILPLLHHSNISYNFKLHSKIKERISSRIFLKKNTNLMNQYKIKIKYV